MNSFFMHSLIKHLLYLLQFIITKIQSMSEYEPHQLIFITKGSDNLLYPAKIIQKCGYGTYLVKKLGYIEQEYISEYHIQPYSEELATVAFENAPKGNKKYSKALKTAQKVFNKPTLH